ncbi:hydroxyacid dehydrogenase [Salinisphaera aquimarina]|uniref:Hydroxyacid dehydrogenase n=1 Tax=Salinisphaera aquimarina TaxID=2094031 RepID=A0ABV7EPV0_9GAMM
MSDVVISEFMDEAPVADLRQRYEVRFEPSLVEDRPALLAAVAAARALIVRNRTRVDAELLDAAPDLEAVGRLGVGLDNIDLEACRARGVQVLPATGANDVAVAEYVIATALLLRRGAYTASASVARGEWPRAALIGHEVAGHTLALVGFGGIARQVATRASALGMNVVAHDPNIAADDACWAQLDVRPLDWEALLEQADVLSLHVPLIPVTRHLLDATALARMKAGAVVINTARGGVIDDAALATALGEGRIAAAAIDVFEDEPLPADSIYSGVDNVLLTPHIAGVTVESNQRVSRVTVDNVLRALAGETA